MSRPVDLLEMAEARGPAGPLLVTLDAALAVDELAWLVDRRVERFREDGVGPDRIHPLTVGQTLESVVSLLALWRMGVTPAPLNASLTIAERAAAVEALKDADPGGQAILWTSGTSGSPRGVVLSADNLLASARAVADRLRLTDADRWLASLSPAHVGGMALLVRPFVLGGSLVVAGRPDAPTIERLTQRSGFPPRTGGPVTHLSLVPTQLVRLLDHVGDAGPPSTLRCVLLGGAHTPEPLLERALARGWPVALTYGMTEMSSQVCTAPPELVREAPGTVGPPLDGVEVRVDAHGEIVCRGRTLAEGLVGGGEALADTDGWYHTGDLGRLDEEGRLWVTGRRSDRIVSGGVTVDAREVEAVLRRHPEVDDAVVVGVADAEWGEVVAALVVPIEGAFDLDRLDAWVRDELGGPRRPRRWRTAATVPLNANGKVDRGAVRERFEADGRGEARRGDV